MDLEALYRAAVEVRERAYAPFSKFRVGAALLTADGSLFTGCNVENRSFGLTICAERTAVVSAVAAGHREFQAVAVVSDTDPAATPCGMCLDTLSEFASDMPVLVADLAGKKTLFQLRDLHPNPFVWPKGL
jgi:cytidine deaminase